MFTIFGGTGLVGTALRERLASLRSQLMGALTRQFELELERSVRRVEDGIAPYVQFVEGERKGLAARQEELAGIDARLSRLTSEIEAP